MIGMTVFLFTDIENSTEQWQKYPRQMATALFRHDAILEETIRLYGGKVVKHTGDGFFAVFEGGEPLQCALEIQNRVGRENWEPLTELRVRVALHTGQAIRRGDDYFGLDVNRTARLLNAAWGGQILLTCELARISRAPDGGELKDMGTHPLKDLVEPLHIYQLTSPSLPIQGFPALRTLLVRAHNLPSQPTAFIGREREMEEVRALLHNPECRLLTLAGPGGIGKTRLAIQSAAEQVENFHQGIYFVALAPLHGAEMLIPAIAEALRFTFYQKENPQEQLFNYLREKKLLLVLDNFEHVIEAAGLIAELLAQAPSLTILVTSRERLSLREELVYELGGLPVPENATDLEQADSARLFLQCAERVTPGFAMDAAERPCVAQICQMLDGMPLGLELAAGWLKMLTCQEIASEIHNNLDFLETNLRDVPERQRSLRAVFDYSWALLTEVERQTLAVLGVFQGAFSREAAETVLTRGQMIRRPVLLSTLSGLVNQSILRHNPDGSYELHSLMRQYALEKLSERSVSAQVARRGHLGYFLGFLAAQEEPLQGRDQKAALDVVASNLDDIRQAWLNAIQLEEWRLALGALNSLYFFYFARGRIEEACQFFGELVSRLPANAPQSLSLRLHIAYAALLVELDHLDEAEPILLEKMEETRRMGLDPGMARAASALSSVRLLRGDYPKAIEYARLDLEYQQGCGNRPATAQALSKLGAIAWTMGDMSAAREYFEQCLGLAREYGSPLMLAGALDQVGVIQRDVGDFESARKYFVEARAIAVDIGARSRLAYILNHLGGLEWMAWKKPEGILILEEAISLARELGMRRNLAYNLSDLGGALLEGETRQPERATPLLEESLSIFEQIGEVFGVALARNLLAASMHQQGKTAQAWASLCAALEQALAVGNQVMCVETLSMLATLAEEEKRPDEAIEALTYIGTVGQNHTIIQDAAKALAQLEKSTPFAVFAVAQERGRSLDLRELTQRLRARAGGQTNSKD